MTEGQHLCSVAFDLLFYVTQTKTSVTASTRGEEGRSEEDDEMNLTGTPLRDCQYFLESVIQEVPHRLEALFLILTWRVA